MNERIRFAESSIASLGGSHLAVRVDIWVGSSLSSYKCLWFPVVSNVQKHLC